MKKASKIIALLLCLCLFFVSCGEDATSDGLTDEDGNSTQQVGFNNNTFRLGYNPKDTLDPYSAKGKFNKELSTLMYDSLFTVDSAYNLIYRIASSYNVSENVCTVALRNDVRFTDGSYVTAYDVEASFHAAKTSAVSGYADDLTHIKSCTAVGDFTVMFELTVENDDIVYAMTFPIYKNGTMGYKNASAVIAPPTGSGRYVFVSLNGSAWLQKNTDWAFGEVKTEKLYLYDIGRDEESVRYCLESGRINCGFDDMSDELLSIANDSDSAVVPLNNIVFLGASNDTAFGRNRDFRQFVSSIIDRESICVNCYMNKATVAKGFYNSSFQKYSGQMKLNTVSSKTLADGYFKNMGLSTERDSDGFFVDEEDHRYTVTIIAQASSNLKSAVADNIASALNGYGLYATVVKCSPEEYSSRLKSGRYDLFVGEMKIGSDLDYTALFGTYGFHSSEVYSSYQKFRSGFITSAEFFDRFEDVLPFIPLCFRLGVSFYPSNLTEKLQPSYTDVYFNIQNCYF